MAEKGDMGSIRIADEVVAVIAGIAASDTPGIASMSGGITEGLANRLMGKNIRKGVKVEVGEEEAVIQLKVIVEYGTKIDEVCRTLQHNVKDAVESMTGLHVVEVNVMVEGVEFPETPVPAGEEQEGIRLK
ncbi:MAG: Asp23/Gls24 family envelope stress response protein [Thermicanus sp.]|nr:Asp23/Gls24 family envelope stress response protein [Thermicanus sp.]